MLLSTTLGFNHGDLLGVRLYALLANKFAHLRFEMSSKSFSRLIVVAPLWLLLQLKSCAILIFGIIHFSCLRLYICLNYTCS